MLGLIAGPFAEAEVAWRRERLMMSFQDSAGQSFRTGSIRRWLAGVLNPSGRHAGRAPMPVVGSPHHMGAAS